jgi:outer membrane immunogenic protein
MKKILTAALLASVAISSVMTSSAFAADLPTRKAAPQPAYVPPPLFTWTGFYVGVNGGYGFASARDNNLGLMGDPNGGLVGGTVGYNYQFGQFVVGYEGDLDFADLSKTKNFADGSTDKARLSSFLTERARVGYAMDRTLLFVTGGYAGGEVHQSFNDVTNGLNFGDQSGWKNGYVVGGGVEYAITNNITAKAEYLFSQLGSSHYFAGPDYTKAGLDVSTIRVGVNYKF